MTVSPSIVEFLNARLDEDEQAAQAATPGPWVLDTTKNDGGVLLLHETEQGPDDHVIYDPQDDTLPDFQHIARHDPARVLRGVEARRELAAAHERVTEMWDQGDGLHDVELCGTCAYGLSCRHCFDREDLPHVAWPCRALRLLASEFDTHEDYQESWKP